MYDQAGDASYNPAPQVIEVVTALPALLDQTITVTTHAPASALNGTSFTVAASASSLLPVSYSSSGSCTNIGADFTMTSGTGTCTVMYDQAGDASYNPAPQMTEVVNAEKATLTVTADDLSKVYGAADPAFTFSYSGFVGGDGESNIDTPPTCSVTGSHVNVGSYPITCSGGSDDRYIFNYVSNDLTITEKSITVTADDQSKVYGDPDPVLLSYTFTPALISGDNFSGNLTRTVGENVGVYAISQGTLSLSSSYNLVYVGDDLTITKADQTIINVTAPANAINGQVFTVSATADPSGLPVSFSSSGSCTNVGDTFTMINGAGDCTVLFDQAGDSNFNAAPQVTRVVADGTAPVVLSSVRADADPTASAIVKFTVTFSESVTGVGISDFALTTTGVSGAAVSGVSGTDAIYTVTVSTGTANGTIRLNVVDDDTIVDAASNPLGSGYTIGETYTVDKGSPTPPSRPTLSSPANGYVTTDYTPLLDWVSSTTPAGTIFSHYQIQLATDSGFTSITLDENISGISNSSFTPLSDLASNTRFYWRVRAVNAYGNASTWSLVRNFRAAILPPVLITPNDATQLLNNRPTFDWNDVVGATNYRIQIANNIGFSPMLTNTAVTPSTYTPTTDLPAGTTLYWRVQANATNGPNVSEIRTLTTANPPGAPTLASPANNAKVSGPSPLFTWSAGSLPAGVVFDHYQIQIATSTAFTTIIHDNNVTSSQDNTAVLLSGTTYQWRVRTFNTLGQSSAWSAVRPVRIIFAGPTLNLPASGSTVSNLMPTFTWDAVSGATSYTIQVSKNSTFSPLVFSRTATSPTYTHTTNLQAGTTYYWRVRVRVPNTYGPGDWSQVFTVTTP
jgi:hypothetical protein